MACTEQNPGETCKWGEYQVWRDSPVDHCYLCIHGSHWESKNQPRRRKRDKTMKPSNFTEQPFNISNFSSSSK